MEGLGPSKRVNTVEGEGRERGGGGGGGLTCVSMLAAKASGGSMSCLPADRSGV